MKLRRIFDLAVVATLAISCKGDSGGGLLGQLEDVLDDQIEFECMCEVAAGNYVDVGSCRTEFGSPFEDLDRDCVNGLSTQAEYRPYLSCSLQAEKDYLACIQAEGCDPEPLPDFMCADGMSTVPADFRCDSEADCDDGSDEVDCENVEPTCFSAYFSACGDPPASYEAALLSCFNTFACADGQDEIPASWQCDGDPDCMDGSDELGC